MNAGMYGQASGDFGSRKVTRQIGKMTAGAGDTYSGIALGLEDYLNTSTIPAGQRTLIYSASGKGAVRFFMVYLSSLSGVHYADVEVDGVVVSTHRFTSTAGSKAVVGMQGSSSAGVPAFAAMDYIPFSSSFNVYVTPAASAGAGGIRWSYLMEAHQ